MEFFSFYKEIEDLRFPFQTFHVVHFAIVFVVLFLVYRLLKYYNRLDEGKQRRFQTYLGSYFLVEELIYMMWLLWRNPQHVWLEILPLQLCSICAIMAVFCILFKRIEFRFFCGVIGTFAGAIAILYPANISGLYPILSYRTLNFFSLHGFFILFGLIQLKENNVACYQHMKKCTLILSVMVFVIFFVNIFLHTDYMFIGVPSSIGFINHIYQFTGVPFFLLVVIMVLIMIQFVVLFVYRFSCEKLRVQTNENKCNRLKKE